MSKAPPKHPSISKRDRSIFERRLKAALEKRGVSARAVEKVIGMATGTVSKLYSGHTKLTLKLLKEISTQLNVGPETLVEETALAAVLLTAPESEASEQLIAAHANNCGLRGELAEAKALLEAERTANAELKHELEKERAMRSVAEEASTRASTKLKEADANRGRLAGELQLVDRDRATAIAKVGRVDRQIQGLTAKCAQAEQTADIWMRFGQERAARVQYLERELLNLKARASKESDDELGKLFLVALAGLGIGVGLSGTSST